MYVPLGHSYIVSHDLWIKSGELLAVRLALVHWFVNRACYNTCCSGQVVEGDIPIEIKEHMRGG